MPLTGRPHHLRLTAAILAALIAAMAGGLDETPRGRRGDLPAALGTLRIVVCDGPVASASPALALGALESAAPLCAASTEPTAAARALRRERLDRSRASGAALLRTTSLPPPLA